MDVGAKTVDGHCSLSYAVCTGNTTMVEWFCQQGEDLHQVQVNGKGALSLAIGSCKPQVARWLLHRGCRLTRRDVNYTYYRCEKQVLGMIFKMTSKIARANFFHSCNVDEKLKLLDLLQLDGDGPSEEEADACFARFNQYNDKTLEHKCIVVLANLIGQQSGALEASLKAVDSLPISSDGKFNLREELVSINLKK